MKLKNKLIISFLMIMAIPLFLFCVFSVVLVRYQFCNHSEQLWRVSRVYGFFS